MPSAFGEFFFDIVKIDAEIHARVNIVKLKEMLGKYE